MRTTFAAATTFTYAPEPDPGLLREIFESERLTPPLWWVYVGGRCVGTAEPDGDGGLVLFPLPLLWEGDQA